MEQKKISVRAFNVCINAGINNLAEIIDYYKRNKTYVYVFLFAFFMVAISACLPKLTPICMKNDNR